VANNKEKKNNINDQIKTKTVQFFASF